MTSRAIVLFGFGNRMSALRGAATHQANMLPPEHAMNSTESTPLDEVQNTGTLLASSNSLGRMRDAVSSLAGTAIKPAPRSSGYGLPCAKCKTYYTADLTTCPVCKTTERVSPNLQAIPIPADTIESHEEEGPDPEILERERERFLQEFKAQSLANGLQINATSSFQCTNEENHEGAFAAAAVCQGCYDHLRERADQLEAALLIDVKDATQMIYEAVWSDPSDPTKTYQNAAQALLSEMRRRAGISSVLGPFKSLQH